MQAQNQNLKKTLSLLAVLVLSTSGLGALSIPAFASESKSIVVKGFAPNSVVLTPSMERKISRFVEKNPSYAYVRCVGFADRPGTKARNNSLGEKRAVAGCAAATDGAQELEISRLLGEWNRKGVGANVRKVRITLSNYATTNITTTFNYNGGQGEVNSLKLAAGSSKTLPTASRTGYSFAGWYDSAFTGKYVGWAGASYTPKKNSTLWALWELPAPSSSSGGSPAPSSVSITSTGCSIGTGLDLVFTNPADVTPVSIATDYPFTLNEFAVFEFTSTLTSHAVVLTGTTNTAERHGVCIAHADSSTAPSWSVGQGFKLDAGLQNINIPVTTTSDPSHFFVSQKYFVYVYPTTSASSARITGQAPRNITLRVN